MLWKMAASVMGNDDEAADMLQETAIKAWRSMPQFDAKSKLSTWLARILLNRCFDELRTKAKVVPFEELARSVDQGAAAPLWSQGIADEAAASCAAMDVSAALGSLRPDDRLLLTLFYGNDLPVTEVASILGISEGAVRTRLTRARARFKERYTGSVGASRATDQDSKGVAL